MLAALSLAAFTAAATLQQGPFATVHGQVRSEGSNAPLRGAVVEIVSPRFTILATTDSTGSYAIREVPLGRRLLRATHIDHAPLEVEVVVSARSELVLDFALELRPVRLPAVTARAIAFKGNSDTLAVGEAALGQASVKVLESSPGVAELGLAEVTREVEGQEPADPTDVLYVRGGTTDLKLVLLNGAPVYAPFHLGGLINPLDGDLMRAARLYVGGAPAKYDGGLSYVMDLETRAGRGVQSHASVAIDLLSSRTVLEGPITSGSTYLLGARSIHGMGARAFFSGNRFPYSYADAIGRFDIDIGQSRLTASGFWNQESVVLDSLVGGRAPAAWGNTSGSLRYRAHMLGHDADITVAAGRFHTQLPVGGVRPIITNGVATRGRVTAQLARNYGGLHMQYGASLDQQHYEYRAWPRSSRDSLLLRSDAEGHIAGFFIDGQWHALKRLAIRSGVRADMFSLDNRARIAPRLAATILLTDKATLTLAAGRYRQYVRAHSDGGFIGTPVPDTIGRPSLAIAEASHLVMGLDQDLGDGVRLAIEGYYKSFDDLPASQGELTEASGVDFWVRRGAGRITGWLGYSLAWVWSVDHESLLARAFAGRQLLSAGVSGLIGAGTKIDVRVAYGAGLPFTAIPEPEATPPVFGVTPNFSYVPDETFTTIATPPDEQYLRVDAQVARTFVTDVRGFAFELTPYFKLLNALDRRDALFYHFDRSQQEPRARAIGALPVLPIVGLEWRF